VEDAPDRQAPRIGAVVSDIHPTAEVIAKRASDLIWTDAVDPSVRKEALRLFLIALVENKRGASLVSRVHFVLSAINCGIVKAGGDWREIVGAYLGVPEKQPAKFPTRPPNPIDELLKGFRR